MDIISVPDAPEALGVRFRNFSGPADYAAIVAVHTARQERDGVDPLSVDEEIPTVEGVARRFERAHHFDPSRDAIFAEVGGCVVGYGQTTWWTEEDGTWLYLHEGYVVPEWRGRGVGTVLLRRLEGHLREISADHPNDGKATFGANASSTETDATRLLLAEGYRAVKAMVEMEFTAFPALRLLSLRDGIALRPPRPEEYRAVWVVIIRAGYERDPVPEEIEQGLEWYRRFWSQDDDLTRPTVDSRLLHVAWDGDEPVGVVVCRIGKGRGEIQEVAVLQEWRRRGIARALLTHGLHALQECGVTMARLKTPGDRIVDGVRQPYRYRTTDFYGSVGFRPLKEFVRYRKPL